MMQRKYNLLGSILLILLPIFILPAQGKKPVAFPSAEGGSKFTTGGRGGKVLIVDNLEEGHCNIVNNYYKPGPATGKNSSGRILDLTQKFSDPRFNTDTLKAGKFYIRGNVLEGHKEVTRNNWKYGVQGERVDQAAKDKSFLKKPVLHVKMKTGKAEVAYSEVLRYAGADLFRDAVDERIIEETRTGIEKYGATFRGGNKGILDSPEDVGGWPVLRQQPPPADSYNDGISDKWEKSHNLDPGNPADNVMFTLSRDYTNLEVYMNSLILKP